LTDLQEGIRRRFSNAYHWYCVLLLSSRKHLQEALEDARSQYGNPWCEEDAGDDMEHAGDDAERAGDDAECVRDDGEHLEEYVERAEDQVRLHPSEYLRGRCSLCYGGYDWRMIRSTENRSVYVLVFLT
jgi:hypothetical protein